MKEFDYVVTLRYGSFKTTNLISGLLLFISAACFTYNASVMPPPSNYYFATATFLIVLFFISLRFINRKEAITLYSYALFISAIAWFVLDGGNKLIGLCMFLAAFLERLAKFPKEIGFNKNEIVFNHFPRKKIAWNKIDNVILKDGILTVDFKSNKIFQKEVEEEVLPKIEKDFNEFCQRCIGKY